MFADYAGGGGVDPAPGAEITWSWIIDGTRVRCLVAVPGGAPGAAAAGEARVNGNFDDHGPTAGGEIDLVACGFVHYREFERPITGTRGLWIDDLYVTPEARGQGIAGRLIEEVRRLAAAGGYDVVRWTTRETNPARRLYDRLAATAPVVVYNATPSPGGEEAHEPPHASR